MRTAETSLLVLAALGALAIACKDEPSDAPDRGDSGAASQPEAPPPPPTQCTDDHQCDDGIFCNGEERCAPRDADAERNGCAPGSPVECLANQRCDELEDGCKTLCEQARDADDDGHVAAECGGDDCNDSDGNRFPGNPEVCDPDNRDEDCDPETYGSRDEDDDGVDSALCCNVDSQGNAHCGPDCDDNRRDVRPEATEGCDGRDNDCDGLVDERVARAGFFDGDFDEHGDPSQPMFSCAGNAQLAVEGDDCDDGNPARHGAQPELCDDVDNDCDGTVDEDEQPVTWYLDADGDDFGDPSAPTKEQCEPLDGYSLRARDCEDGAAGVNPAAPEVCDGADNDCDGEIDEDVLAPGYADADGDGYGDPSRPRVSCPGTPGFSQRGGDCDDRAANRYQDRPEECDEVDNDCDADVDEGVLREGFVDADHDLHGDPKKRATYCLDAPGFAAEAGDCDDGDPSVYEGQAELCDGKDNDCDPRVDEDSMAVTWYRDADGDGFGAVRGGTAVSCAPLPGYALLPLDCDDAQSGINPGARERCNGIDDDCNGRADHLIAAGDYEDDDRDGAPDVACDGAGSDCNDRAPSVHPGALELCDGRDNDCDEAADEDSETAAWFADDDGDGYGDTARPAVASCLPLAGFAARPGDCDDSDPRVRPGASDDCDGADDDCDGALDENAPQLAFYADADGDGYAGGQAQFGCAVPAGYETVPGDCDDRDPSRRPGAAERCDGRDDDCDGKSDEGVGIAVYRDRDGDGYGSGSQLQACPGSAGFARLAGDCDEQSPAVHPNGVELCDGADNDCDQRTDENVAPASWYVDADGDGYGSAELPAQSSCAPLPGRSLLATDCDDRSGATSPVARELCDGRDNDCDRRSDEGLRGARPELCEGREDEDCDGAVDESCECIEGSGKTCPGEAQGDCEPGLQICTGGHYSECVGRVVARAEVCGGGDEDCDGSTDEGLSCGASSNGGSISLPPPIQCGSQSCPAAVSGTLVIPPCCDQDSGGGCGLALLNECEATNQAGTIDPRCPPVARPLGGSETPGCCRPDGMCGAYSQLFGCVERSDLSATFGGPLTSRSCDAGTGGTGGSGGTGGTGGTGSGPPFALSSTAFSEGEFLPAIHNCGSLAGPPGTSPPLAWTAGPAGTLSYTLIMRDSSPQGTSGAGSFHWVIADIPSSALSLTEGVSPGAMPSTPAGAKQITNDFGDVGFRGPCSASDSHEYTLTLYAVDRAALPDTSSAQASEQSALASNVGTATLRFSALQPLCEQGSTAACSSYVSLEGAEVQLGPYGAVMDVNQGAGFENLPLDARDSDSNATCTTFIPSFAAEPAASQRILDIGTLDFALYTVYRPARWVTGETYPILTWGNGTCMQPETYGALLRYLASQGFVVVAANSRWVGSQPALSRALDFLFAANEDSASPYYHRLDTTRVGAMGHSQGGTAVATVSSDSRVDAAIVFNAVAAPTKPYLVVSGDNDIAFSSVTELSMAIAAQPQAAFVYFHMVPQSTVYGGHLVLASQPHRVIDATTAWWRMRLYSDAASAQWFLGADCGLCNRTAELEYGQHGLP